MNNIKKLLPIALVLVFLGLGIDAFLESKPSSKNEYVYTFVKAYSPYYIEKRFGGLQIKSKEDTIFKETPSNMELFKQFESLEKEWGQKHLKLENGNLVVLDDNGTAIDTLSISTEEELTFIHIYYGI